MLKKDCINYILQKVPELSAKWEEHLDFWDGDEPGICNDLNPLVRFTVDCLEQKKYEILIKIFNIAEELLTIGDSDVKDAIATCFLESLINIASSGIISGRSFANFLGEKSKEQCRAWDKFNGVKTDGL